MEPTIAIQEFLSFIMNGLVEHPDELSITRELEGSTHRFLIQLHPDDTGRIIGRGGKTIRAIRSLVNASAQKHQLHAEVMVLED